MVDNFNIMRHLKKGKKLRRKRDQRNALLRIMAGNLIMHEKIKTTETKAKVLRPFVEKLITKGKAGDLHSVRYLARFLEEKARKKALKLAERYKDRPGGYTRIIKLGHRKRDGAKMAIIEFVK